MIHCVDDYSDPPKRKVSRTMSVRYRVYCENYIEDEDGYFAYDKDEIAKAAIPYLKILLDINNDLITDFPDGN
jgi:hypothetical protein